MSQDQRGTHTLINDARAGDEAAVEQLLDRHRGFIHKALRRQGIDDTGLKTADDLFQSVAFIVARGLTAPGSVSTKERAFFDSVTDARSFRRLLGRVVVVRSLKAFRYESAECRKGTVQLPDGAEPFGPPSGAPDPADDALGNLVVAEVTREIAARIENGAAVLEDYLAGVPVSESARQLGVSERTLERARTMIRKILQERFEQDFSAIRGRAAEDGP